MGLACVLIMTKIENPTRRRALIPYEMTTHNSGNVKTLLFACKNHRRSQIREFTVAVCMISKVKSDQHLHSHCVDDKCVIGVSPMILVFSVTIERKEQNINLCKISRVYILFIFHGMLILIFANSLDPHHARQNIGPGLDSSCLALWCYHTKEYFE